MSTTGSSFYVTGGTLPHDALCYVERQEDRDLFDGLLKGEFCYVLTSRQMGKSSLMVRTSHKLRIKGINVVALDLTAIGQNLSPEQWYDGLAQRLGRQLQIEDELENFWKNNQRVSPVQRFFSALRDLVMVKRPGPLVLFVDEIDTVRSLPFSTDEFFSAIRECYNRRTEDQDFHRLTFCLLGVATPSDLIRDARITPFHLGRRIELNDFTEGEAAPLANGMGRDPRNAARLLQRILYWTNGHPYLTQRLCQAVADDSGVNSAAGVDRWCETLFLASRARERDDNLLFVRGRLLRSETDLAGLLSLYEQVRAGKRVRDEETNRLAGILRLSGIARGVQGELAVRNRIYARVFDRRWLAANMPDQEIRRQRAAFRKGISRGVAFAAILVATIVSLSRWAQRTLDQHQAARAIQNLAAVYNGITSYEDHTIINTDVSMEGAKVTTSGLASMAMAKPNKLNFRIKTQMGIGETDVQVISNGEKLAVFLPLSKEYLVKAAPDSIQAIFDDVSQMTQVGIPAPLYQMIASWQPQQVFRSLARDVQVLRREELADRKAYLMRWAHGHASASATGPNGNGRSPSPGIPVTAWVDQEDGLFRQTVMDLSGIITNSWMPNLTGRGLRRVTLTKLVITTTHTGIKLNPPFRPGLFDVAPPPDARRVETFEVTRRFAARTYPEVKPTLDRAKLPALISPRDPQAPPGLIDLSRHYNAPLTESWHSDRPGNNLALLPRGRQVFAGTEFDVRGIVQLAGQAVDYLKSLYPEEVKNIQVGRTCRRLHFLHGTGWSTAEGTQIGSYVIHYAGGEQRVFPILYGFDVRDWWPHANEPEQANGLVIAWQGANDASKPLDRIVRLFKSTWQNPLPTAEIAGIDFVSSMTEAAPFLISIAAE